MLELSPHLQQHLPKENTFDRLLDWPGNVHRHIKHRRTVEAEIGGRRYFIKAHRGCGWREVWKDWLSFRPPIVSARTEWEAIERAQRLGIATVTVAGKGERGRAPAQVESFLITEALDGMIHLEDLTRDWGGLTGRRQKLLKRALLERIARIARALHEGGMNHRDFYLGHFLVKDRRWADWLPGDPLEVFLIDLHRVQSWKRLPLRWRVKDLGALLYAAIDIGLTKRDLLRFVEIYRGQPWRESLNADARLWRRVWRNTARLLSVYQDGRKLPAWAAHARPH